MEPEDLLNYANDPEITSRIGTEKIFYSDKQIGKLFSFNKIEKIISKN